VGTGLPGGSQESFNLSQSFTPSQVLLSQPQGPLLPKGPGLEGSAFTALKPAEAKDGVSTLQTLPLCMSIDSALSGTRWEGGRQGGKEGGREGGREGARFSRVLLFSHRGVLEVEMSICT
jgi:hypothetical protein